jgi:hypothetical protein
MAHSIQWSLSIKINGGPQLSSSKAIDVEAYDSIRVTILGTGNPGGPDVDKEVEIQPGSAGGQVTFLAITSDRYDPTLTYKVNADTNPAIALDQPHVLVGEGAVALLDPAPTRLFFSSSIAQNTEVQILAGRDATP